MRYRPLGDTGLTVSEVGFGLWTVASGWWGTYTSEQALGLVREAHDLGITLFDTAPTYGPVGLGETLLADALGSVRERVVYSTKVGYDLDVEWSDEGHRERPQRTDPPSVRASVDASLQRLRTDVIDVLQVHNPKMTHVQQDDLWATLDALRDEGKVRAHGSSIGPRIGWRDEGLEALRRRRGDVLMIIHNMLEQDPGREFLDAARRIGTPVMVRVPHASGLLDGSLTRRALADARDHRSFRDAEWLAEGLRKVEALGFLTERMTLGQAAIKWLLADPAVATVLPNIYNAPQLAEFCAAPGLPDLDPADVARVSELFDRGFRKAG